MEIALNVAEWIGVVAHAMGDEVIGLQSHMKGEVFLHIGGNFGALQCCRVAAGEFFGESCDVIVQLFLGNNLGNQADALGFLSGKISSRERNEECLLDRYTGVEERWSGGCAITSSNHFRHSEFGGSRGDHEIVAVDHGETTAEAPTFDRSHGNLRKVSHDGDYFD